MEWNGMECNVMYVLYIYIIDQTCNDNDNDNSANAMIMDPHSHKGNYDLIATKMILWHTQ